MCKSSALAGWKEEKIFFERVCKTLPRLVGWLFLFPTSQGRAFHTLSKNIYSSSQPGQKYFWHLQKILNSFSQSGESFYTLSERIFYSSSQSGQKYFWHLFKQYFYFSNQPGQSFYAPSQRIFYSSSQSGQKNDLMVLFRRIKNISKKNSFTIKNKLTKCGALF